MNEKQIWNEIENGFNTTNNSTKVSTVVKSMFVIWVLGACISLTLTGLIVWVAIHFVSKYW